MNLSTFNAPSIGALENVAVDRAVLATNLPDLPDCYDKEISLKSELITRFPLVTWLLGTPMTARIRSDIRDANITYKDCDGKWQIKAPRELWSLEIPDGENEECCWAPFDFAKCGGESPLNLLCLKDCDNIMDDLMGRTVRFGANVPGLANAGDSQYEIKRRVARLSMAFLTAYNVILGEDDVFTNILKPFHGLMQVMENPAITTINGTNILMAFDSVACRLSMLGGGQFVIAIHPIVYQGLLNEIRVGQFGQLPVGWTRNGDELSFRGIRFIQDRFVPVDMEAGTGEAWVLNADAVGLYLATNLMPEGDYIRTSGHIEETREDGCASQCTYYYNIGAVVANNANKLMRIVDIPLSGACTAAIGDLGALITPKTLIPRI